MAHNFIIRSFNENVFQLKERNYIYIIKYI